MAAQKLYPEFKNLDLPAISKEILDWWEKEKVFEQSVTSREGAPSFVFYEGPPSANGMPGIHHVMSRTIKDLFCRYHTLKGEKVERKSGWDTHGLPVEISVEKTLGIRKDDIGKKISVEDYNAACRKEVMKYKAEWDRLTKLMGYWVDLDHPYITFENDYIESCWWLLQQLYKKNLLYKGYTIQPYSPAAGTGLSSHELNQPGAYRPIKDTSVIAQFKVIREEKCEFLFKDTDSDVYFIAWTTTPWTLPSNTALAVGKDITYISVQTFNPYTYQPVVVILAKDLFGKYFDPKNSSLKFDDYKSGDKNIPYAVLNEFKGNELSGIRYNQLLPYTQPKDGKAFEVVVGDFVTTEDGTGIVHIAPSFGADDFRMAKQYGLGSLTLVDKQGRFTAEVTDFAGEYVKEQYLTNEEKETERKKQGGDKYLSVDERISIKLKKENKAFKVEKFEHNYPHCWRTDKPILYYPLDSWFVRTTACRERMIELNNTINWKPEATGTGRFGNWLENLVDWNLSRSRFWGIPLPIWRSEDGREEICIGSVEELHDEIEKSIKVGFMNTNLIPKPQTTFDLHKPYIDNVILVSPSGKKMIRESDLIDVWFDSGSMPYAQWHYPFQNKEKIDKGMAFPADFIAEGVDQTRGWFFTLHAIAAMVFDSVAFKNVVSNGLVLDKNGNKMSKRLGNAADPFEIIAKYGPDAVRWYMVTNASPWDNLKFDVEGIAEKQRSLFGTLYNTYSFFALYANIDGFKPNAANQIPFEKKSELDRWILSSLNTLIEEVTRDYDAYDATPAGRAIENFVDAHLSNWYIRLSRRRFWKGEINADKQAAYETLHECLTTVAQLISPIAPFFAEWLYKNLVADGSGTRQPSPIATAAATSSVHLTYLKKANNTIIDKDLEERMELAQKISSMILSIRKKENLRVRQPLQRVQVPVLDASFKRKVEQVKDLILSEVNVKQLEFVDEKTTSIVKDLKLNFKTLGKKYGKHMKAIQQYAAANAAPIIAAIENNGRYETVIDNDKIELLLDDVEIIPIDMPGWKVANDGSVTVALDIAITPELKEEGMAREFVNRIQNLRKDKGFEVTDKISLTVQSSEAIKNSLINNKEYICAEILATSFQLVDTLHSMEAVKVEMDDQISTMVTIKKN
jgi:isoleucyl-tRNA synthetase